jgi:HEAT repeat protein
MQLAAASAAAPAAGRLLDEPTVDRAFEALRTYDEGASRGALVPLDEVVRVAVGAPSAQKELALRLAAVLQTQASTLAKEYVCAKLGLIGSADSVPALAALLPDAGLCHAACNALESIPGPESVEALRRQLPRLNGLQKAAVITALGMRRDARSVSRLADLQADSNADVARAAIAALGHIGTPAAGRALARVRPKAPESLRLPWGDAGLACAEQLLADGRRSDARALYESVRDSSLPKHVQLAAARGVQMATGLK